MSPSQSCVNKPICLLSTSYHTSHKTLFSFHHYIFITDPSWRKTTEINRLGYRHHIINKSCIGILPHHISIRPDYPIIYHIALQAREHFPHKTLSFLHYSKLCQNDWLFYCLERLSNRLLFQTGTRGSSWRALLAPRLSGLTSSHSSRFYNLTKNQLNKQKNWEHIWVSFCRAGKMAV